MKKNKKKKEESIEDVKQKYPFADEMLTTIRQEYETERKHLIQKHLLLLLSILHY